MSVNREIDVLVIGGGNAGLCAAISAAKGGAHVLVLEYSPRPFRGGNSRHTRNIRCMHNQPEDVLLESYTEKEYWDDLLKVTGGETDEQLARLVIRSSASCRVWMAEQGVRFQPSLGGTLHLSRTNAFFLGGGKALMNAYYRQAEMLGVDIRYDAEVVALDIRDGKFRSASVKQNGDEYEVKAKTVVMAAGGFESNIDWLKEIWGPAADNFIIRGTPYNKGHILKMLLGSGAKPIGDPSQCHAVAIDARAPRFDGGIVTRVDCVSLGIVVNKNAERFYDEGEDFWPKRYAIWGRLVAAQPDQIAYSIIDSKALGKFMPPVFPPIKAHTIGELAKALGLNPEVLVNTVDAFNRSVQPGSFDHTVLDQCMTKDLVPVKSHWARAIDQAPFFAYPLRPGITFTYLGVKVDDKAQMINQDDKTSENIYAAGEIMAGNILGKGYVAGFGMTIGTTFGRIAGTEAARNALR
jgi:tricarballylate dehydrogenase